MVNLLLCVSAVMLTRDVAWRAVRGLMVWQRYESGDGAAAGDARCFAVGRRLTWPPLHATRRLTDFDAVVAALADADAAADRDASNYDGRSRERRHDHVPFTCL